MSCRLSLLFLALATAACGKQIGDSCTISTDCDPNNTRICDPTQPDGYCTIVGCDYDTCPSESVCVAFYVGEFSNKPCDPATEDLPSSAGTDACNVDEVCRLDGQCVPRSAEFRYCMKTCSSNGDCRDRYECRDETLMKEHGGEPVLAPGDRPSATNLSSFCAQAPSTL